MNLSQVTLARSDQLNADDLIGGPRTFTVTEVRRGDSEQPVAIVLEEFPSNRPFKPSKTVLRLLSYVWGEETDDWPERPRFTLYRDAKVKWAGQEIGGIRVSHMSHITEPKKIALAESKGKKTLHTIQPLPDAPTAPAEPTPAELAAQVAAALADATTADEVRDWGNRAHARNLLDITPDSATGMLRELVVARLAELSEEQA